MLSADIVSPGFVAVIVILIVVLLILSSCIKIVTAGNRHGSRTTGRISCDMECRC